MALSCLNIHVFYCFPDLQNNEKTDGEVMTTLKQASFLENARGNKKIKKKILRHVVIKCE